MNQKIEDIIQIEGVNCKGYGLIFKAVMLDTELSLTAKAIYAYLCSYTGAGACIFPGRDKILHDLNMSKKAYYSHYNTLIEQGYIEVKKRKGYLNRNTYTIVSNPKKIKEVSACSTQNSQLKLNGLGGFGYGFIPKAIMLDKRLDVKAKGLVAYFYALAQSGCCVFPKKRDIFFHLNIGNTSYYKALNQLILFGYITTVQRTKENGTFSINDYYLNTFPTEEPPCSQKEDNEKKPMDKPFTPCTQKEDNGENLIEKPFTPCTQKEDNEEKTILPPCSQKGDNEKEDNNNSTSVNSTISISSIYQQGKCKEESKVHLKGMTDREQTENDFFDFETVYDKGLPIAAYNHPISNNTITKAIRMLTMLEDMEQDLQTDRHYKGLYRLAVNCLSEMATEAAPKQYRGSSVSAWQVIEQINLCLEEDECGLSLRDFLHGLLVNFQRAQETYKIKNPYAYMKSMLWDYLNCYNC